MIVKAFLHQFRGQLKVRFSITLWKRLLLSKIVEAHDMQSENKVSQSTRQTALMPTSDVNRRVLLEAYSAEFLVRAVARNKQTHS